MNAVFLLGIAIGIVMIAVGLYALLAPHPLSRSYGVPAHDATATSFVRATGVRDLAFGAVLVATSAFHLLALTIVVAIAGLVIAIADFLIAYHHHGRRWHPAHGIHLSGVVAFVLVLAMALFAIGK